MFPGTVTPEGYAVTYTYNPTAIPNDAVSLVRALLQDTDFSVLPPAPDATVDFSDQDIQGFLALSPNGDPMLAAANALRSKARKLTIQGNSIAFGDLRVDTSRTAMQLLKEADDMDAEAARMPAEAIVEQDWNAFIQRRLLRNAGIRAG